jgi:hypothetical protein
MDNSSLERCARAMREVLNGYAIRPTIVQNVYEVTFCGQEVRIGGFAECRSWIDEQAARACILAQLPVADEVVDQAIEAADEVSGMGKSSEQCSAIIAAIRAIAGGENV